LWSFQIYYFFACGCLPKISYLIFSNQSNWIQPDGEDKQKKLRNKVPTIAIARGALQIQPYFLILSKMFSAKGDVLHSTSSKQILLRNKKKQDCKCKWKGSLDSQTLCQDSWY
jgi:hypothetical protein